MSVTSERAGRVPFSSQVDEWPYTDFPTGWFQIGWVDETSIGEVKAIRFFGTDLVQFRSEAGRIHVLDAYCGHLGAHLGHGGSVDGECLICPFHGWRWNGEGINQLVPAESAPMDRRRQRSWPVRVTNGIIWLWHDALGRGPSWEPHPPQPEYRDPDYYSIVPHFIKRYTDVGGRPQYLTENNSDVEHLRWVHGTKSPVKLLEQRDEGPFMHTKISMIYGHGKARTRFTPDGPIETSLDSITQGVGTNMVRYPLDGTVTFYCATPVEERRMTLYQTVFARRGPDDGTSAPTGMAAVRLKELVGQFAKDFPIWEHQHYIKKSPLTRDEAKPMGTVRQWAAQFYP